MTWKQNAVLFNWYNILWKVGLVQHEVDIYLKLKLTVNDNDNDNDNDNAIRLMHLESLI